MTNDQFLLLKIRYYADVDTRNLVRTVQTTGTPGSANNREQNALRWGYETAMRDFMESMKRGFEHLIQGPLPESMEEPEGVLSERGT